MCRRSIRTARRHAADVVNAAASPLATPRSLEPRPGECTRKALSARGRRAETIGRPVGDPAFLARLERQTGRPLSPARRGRKPKTDAARGHGGFGALSL